MGKWSEARFPRLMRVGCTIFNPSQCMARFRDKERQLIVIDDVPIEYLSYFPFFLLLLFHPRLNQQNDRNRKRRESGCARYVHKAAVMKKKKDLLVLRIEAQLCYCTLAELRWKHFFFNS